MALYPNKSRGWRYKIILFLTLTASILLLLSMIEKMDHTLGLFGDYVQYWASGRLLIRGSDPYSWDLIENIKKNIGHLNPIDNITPSMFRYPPWSLIFVIPFGYMNYTISRVVWFLVHITIIYISALLLWKIFGGTPKNRWYALLIAFTFAPTIFILGIGHFTTFHLLGATLFLYFTQYQRHIGKKSDFLAGFFSSFVSIKPNVLLLFLFSIPIWVFIKRRWYVLLGILAFILLGLVVVLIFDNQVIQQYWEIIRQYSPVFWDTPTLGMLLRHIFGLEKTWLLAMPLMVGTIWLCVYLKNMITAWEWQNEISIIILMSTVWSPYIWTYDMVVLLIPIIYLFVKISCIGFNVVTILICIPYALINLLTFYLHLYLHDFWFFWLSPTYLLWFLLSIKYIEKNLSPTIDKPCLEIISS